MKMIASMMLAIFLLVACGEKQLSDVEYIRKAKGLQQQGDLDSSVIELKNALKFNPNNAEARWLLGLIYNDLAKWESSEKELKTALQLGVDKKAIYPALMQTLLKQGEYKKVIEEIEISENFNAKLRVNIYAAMAEAHMGIGEGDKANAYIKMGVALDAENLLMQMAQVKYDIYQGKYKTAQKLLGGIVVKYPDNYSAFLLKGRVEGRLKLYKEAEESYSIVIDNSAGLLLTAYMHRALLRVRVNEFEKAELDLAQIKNKAPNHPQYFFAKGLLSMRKRNFIDAKGFFENALKYAPDSVETWLFLGGVYFELGNLEQAEKNLNKVVVKKPDNYHARKILTKVLVRANKLEQAKQIIKPVIEKLPEDPSVVLIYGKILMGLGEINDAVPILQKAFMLQWDQDGQSNFIGAVSEQATLESMIGEYPENIQSQILLILAYIRVNKLSEAGEEAAKFINAFPESALPHTLKGMVLAKNKKYKEAKKSFLMALQNRVADPLATLHLGKVLVLQGEMQEAENVFLTCLEKFPNHPLILPQVANLAAKSGRLESAKEYLQTWVKIYPESLEARLALVNFFIQSRDPFSALEVLRKPPQLNLDNVFALKFLGDIYLAMNAPASAVSAYGRMVGAQPNSPIAYYLLAKVYERVGDSRKAKLNIKKALRESPSHTPSRLSLAHIYITEGEIEKAGEIIAGLEKDENNADKLVLLGRYELATGDSNAAISYYEQALSISKSPKAAVQLAKAYYTIKEVGKGIDVLQKWLENNPRDIAVRYILANSLLQSGAVEKAKVEFKNILQDAPDHILALNNLAFISIEEDFQLALEYAQKAYLLAQNQPEIIDTYGVILLKAGKVKEALDKLVVAHRKRKGDQEIALHYAQALIANGDEVTARDILKDSINGKLVNKKIRQEAIELLEMIGE